MSVLPISTVYVSVEEYLEAEEALATKHEYLAGLVYAMSGSSTAHIRIAMALHTGLAIRLKGTTCEPLGSDSKMQFNLSGDTYFYYPDAMIACNLSDSPSGICDAPVVIFEIISESTRTTDEREKRHHYLRLPSLQAYVRIEQERAEVIVEQRAAVGWTTQVLKGREAILRLDWKGLELPLAELYERVVFADSARA